MEQILFILVQVFNLLLIAAWLLLAISTIIALQHREMKTSQYLVWTALIIFIPFLGAAVFFGMVKPLKVESLF